MTQPLLIICCLLTGLLGSGAAFAQALEPPQAEIAPEERPAEIEEVTIVGEAAGPGLWKVRNGDNTLYLR